ncbi:MAG TPA: DNA polymerase III subunit gamma/tau [Acidimicrobiales bacterium]|nr:DNA polymerase III subunit gamma/tau [Acidimicrobiales bacterium]
MAEQDAAEVPYQSLYRRFRPQRFDEVRGQDHVCLALRNAVRDGRVGHAYLMSGPRGTGKTSTARILAKALNCVAPQDGEPCGECASCVEIARGTSLDVHELDAASNNGVDAMRDLVARAALGTPGRWKVYIVDEVHMLSTAASNALLKTLEEPPGHVVFVLATTDPQKVLPTIRSRTQHLEFRLLGPDNLHALLQDVRSAAGLDVEDDRIDLAVRRGRGSARDALSALDQVAAGGVVDDDAAVIMELARSLGERDTGRALAAMAQASAAGRDPQRLAVELSDTVRQGFLSLVAPDLVTLLDSERAPVADLARQIGLAGVVRALEVLGEAQVGMRDAPDPRIHLEVALVRLTHPEADDSPAALLERIERLEHALATGAWTGPGHPGGEDAGPLAPAAAPPSPAPHATTPSAPTPSEPAPEAGGTVGARGDSGGSGTAAVSAASGAALARETLGAVRRRSRSGAEASPKSAEASPKAGATPTATSARTDEASAVPSRDDLVRRWGDGVLAGLPGRARARFRVGRFLSVEDGVAVYALPNETHRSYCEDVRLDVEEALRAAFGVPVGLRLVVDEEEDAAGAPPAASGGGSRRPVQPTVAVDTDDPDDDADLLDPAVLEAETEIAGAGPTPQERLLQAFPGAEEL